MLIYVMILIILMLFQNRPAGDKRGPCGRPGAREHCVGDPCSRWNWRLSGDGSVEILSANGTRRI